MIGGRAWAGLRRICLDTANGRPAAGLCLTLRRIDGGRYVAMIEAATNPDGRCDARLLEGDTVAPDVYQPVFQLGRLSRQCGAPGRGAGALRHRRPVRAHLPLPAAPFGYTTCRGS